MSEKYRIIYADPPWNYSSRSKVNNGGTEDNTVHQDLAEKYDSMTVGDLCDLPVRDIIKDESACFLWVTDSHLAEGLEVMKAWGFTYKTIGFVWLKKTVKGNNCVNVAPWTLKSTEVCLFGTRGAMTKHKENNSVYQFIEAVRKKHSQKPEEARKRIEELFGDQKRLEMFARERHEGWDIWGNELENDVELKHSNHE